MKDWIRIDGELYTSYVSGYEDLEIIIEEGADGDTTVSTSQLVLFGEGYTKFSTEFFKNICDAPDKTYEIVIYLCSIGKPLKFLTETDGIDVCVDECKVKINVKYENEDDVCLKYFKDNVYWTDGFLQDAAQKGELKKIAYVKEHWTMPIMLVIYTLLFPILKVIDFILDAIEFLTGKRDRPNFVEGIEDIVLGGGRWAVGQRVEHILDYNAKECGLTLKSEIFKDPIYKNLHYCTQDSRKGLKIADCQNQYRIENFKNITVREFLNFIKEPFNAKWLIVDGELWIDRHDRLEDPPIFINLDEKEPENAICISSDKSLWYASGKYEYSLDSIDVEGNETLGIYNDRVEWNKTKSRSRKGVNEVTVEAGGARHTHDEYADTFYKTVIDILNRELKIGSIKYEDFLVTEADTWSLPKLLILDGRKISENGCDFYYTIKTRRDNLNKYNSPMFFEDSKVFSNLYTEFHYIDDPNNKLIRPFLIEELVFTTETMPADIEHLLKYRTWVGLFYSKLGKGIPQRIKIKPNTNKITFENITFKCKI